MRTHPEWIAMGAGASAFALLAGALGFELLGGLPPCEMCHWQRWPHAAASFTGLAGGAAVALGILPARSGFALALATALLIFISGAVGVYHAGVEWAWWAGPAGCTGGPFTGMPGETLTGNLVVRCDEAPWRLFGLSLAGYNALLSTGVAAIALTLIARRTR